MSGSNNVVSNGTCYTAAGKKLGAGFIPCGNDAFGYQTCCGAGDNCLADLACFGVHGSGYGSFLTYFAGCTDPNYKDASCPNKQVDQPWVALTLCDNSGGAWAICSQQGNPSTLQPGSFCSCTSSASATVAFKDATSLANFASLPQSTGQTISFYAGHSPTAVSPTAASPTAGSGTNKPTSNAGGSSSPAAGSTTVSSVSTLPGGSVTTVYSIIPTSSSGGQSGSSGGKGSSRLGTGAIVGIAIGALIAVLLLIILAFLLLRRRRQQQPSRFENEGENEGEKLKLSKKRESDMSAAPPVFVRPTTPSMPEADGAPVSEMMGRPAEPWKLRSELEGKQVVPGRSEALPTLAELPGSEPEPRRDAATGPIESAMVAPLNLRPKSETVGHVPPHEEGPSTRP